MPWGCAWRLLEIILHVDGSVFFFLPLDQGVPEVQFALFVSVLLEVYGRLKGILVQGIWFLLYFCFISYRFGCSVDADPVKSFVCILCYFINGEEFSSTFKADVYEALVIIRNTRPCRCLPEAYIYFIGIYCRTSSSYSVLSHLHLYHICNSNACSMDGFGND